MRKLDDKEPPLVDELSELARICGGSIVSSMISVKPPPLEEDPFGYDSHSPDIHVPEHGTDRLVEVQIRKWRHKRQFGI